ncbi:MAG: hypothetical protein WEC37_02830 [Anaerolineales bacterium]
MYQNTYNYVESRVQELRRHSELRAAYSRQITSDLGTQFRQGAGEALIALGSWIKSGNQNTNLTPARLGGR